MTDSARRLLLIVHPTAGGGRGAGSLPEVVAGLALGRCSTCQLPS